MSNCSEHKKDMKTNWKLVTSGNYELFKKTERDILIIEKKINYYQSHLWKVNKTIKT